MIKTTFFILKKMLFILSYVVILLYTFIFPTPVSWVVFYFFTLLFIFLWVTTLITWKDVQFEFSADKKHLSTGFLKLKTRFYFPILVSNLDVTIGNDKQSFSTRIPSLFKYRLVVPFEQLSFKRGKYDTLLLRTYGKDYLGVFTHRSKQRIPVDLSIYPKHLPFDTLYPLLQQLNTRLDLKLLSGHQSAQFRQLREHQAKDSLKDIDWKTSFKKQSLMVKEYDKESDTAVTIVFLGYQTEYFEELLRLAYNLYLEISHSQAVKLRLIGNFEDVISLKETKDCFLTIQPALDSTEMDSILENEGVLPAKTILISPKNHTSLVKENPSAAFYSITEDTLNDFQIGGV
ncbi:DUF58 domain-containing protein [Desemzia incerta]|uniref:DUF58 domain-containing protein n=1 Tax=Desemzia incerta TaxID=82801 RepID=UPI003D034A09